MAITYDPLWVTTHEDLARLLYYAVPGARVTMLALGADAAASALERAGRYVITLERIGHAPLVAVDSYALPALADPIARGAVVQAESALRVADGGRALWELGEGEMAAKRAGMARELGLRLRMGGR